MKTLEKVRLELVQGRYEYSRHAFKRSIERNISRMEIQQAGKYAEMIENYPDDKYSPSCLLLGFTEAGRPLHIQVSLIESVPVKIITLYEPNEMEWIDYSKRR